MGGGCGVAAETGLWDIVARVDARLVGRDQLRIDFDNPPAPGDTVLIHDGQHVRAIVFDEVIRPMGRVWIIGVIKVAGSSMSTVGVLSLLA